jgi:hypothetical protein
LHLGSVRGCNHHVSGVPGKQAEILQGLRRGLCWQW